MKKESDSGKDGITAAISVSPISQDQQRIPATSLIQSDGRDFTGLYASIFPPRDSGSISLTPSSCSADEENQIATQDRLYLARLTLEYQELAEKFIICLSRLRETEQEVEVLRQENAELMLTNGDLTRRLSLLSLSGKHISVPNRVGSPGFPLQSVMNDFQRFCVGDAGQHSRVAADSSEASPTSVLGFDKNRFQKRSVERVSLPKSISVRSSGFLKMSQPPGNGAGSSSSHTNKLRVTTPVTEGLVGSQRVCVPGGKESLEFDVYNQGMFKTELCNKWQETGTCPYGEHCQFAHGIGELRPVIRHPRYKTEVCRMVLAGDTCPYGHRCHFRHALTEQDGFVGPPS